MALVDSGPREPSGRFVLRVDPRLHDALRRLARERGLSLNAYCVRRLSACLTAKVADDGECTVRRAEQLFGDDLIGLVVFGSWARGEAGDRSDVDVLVVLEPTVQLTRELYRRWDEEPVLWSDRSVEPHFVHLPGPEAVVRGVWSEVALDGIVILERGLRLSRWLIRVRGLILSGRMARRTVHGQPFWVEASVDEEP